MHAQRAHTRIRPARAHAAEKSHRERKRRHPRKARLRDQHNTGKGQDEWQNLPPRHLLAKKQPGEQHREKRRRLVQRLPFGDRDVRQRVEVGEDANGAERRTQKQKTECRQVDTDPSCATRTRKRRGRHHKRNGVSEEALLEARNRRPVVVAQADEERHQGEPEGAGDECKNSL